MKLETTRITFTVPTASANELERLAREKGVGQGALLREAMRGLGITVPEVKAGNPNLGGAKS